MGNLSLNSVVTLLAVYIINSCLVLPAHALNCVDILQGAVKSKSLANFIRDIDEGKLTKSDSNILDLTVAIESFLSSSGVEHTRPVCRCA